MKKTLRFTLHVGLLVGLILLASCGKTPKQIEIRKYPDGRELTVETYNADSMKRELAEGCSHLMVRADDSYSDCLDDAVKASDDKYNQAVQHAL